MIDLPDLHDRFGQSPWLDNLRRDWLRDGTLARWVGDGVRGVTSNPSIFQKAMGSGDAYDAQLAQLLEAGSSVEDAYWTMAKDDIAGALDILAPVHEQSGGADGFVSLELGPDVAHDAERSIVGARGLHAEIDRPNLMVKVPGTAEGVVAVRQLTADGLSINVTLIFGLTRYAEVMEAYLAGLEERAATDPSADLSTVHGVASFFVSRVDSEVDARLEALGSDEARRWRGQTAVAQAQAAYQQFRETFRGPRWDALAARGAQVQRPLWASTSTKNPAYRSTLYVDELIGPDTVNTMPEATLEAFRTAGTLARTIDADPAAARAVLAGVGSAGVDLEDVAATLEAQGVELFAKAHRELLATLRDSAVALGLTPA